MELLNNTWITNQYDNQYVDAAWQIRIWEAKDGKDCKGHLFLKRA